MMSEQFKNYVAYIIGISIHLFAWSVFRTWEPPVRGPGMSVTRSAYQASAAKRSRPPSWPRSSSARDSSPRRPGEGGTASAWPSGRALAALDLCG
jgi:hypothetical protein